MQFHGSYTVPVTLLPLMDYNFDIELDPASPSPSPEASVLPLFRRSFSTSKFASIEALADDVRQNRIRFRWLSSQIDLLPAAGHFAAAADKEIQDALFNAGDQALPASSQTGITIYWAKRPGGTAFKPHVIMIDAAEPLWRTRIEPELEVVPGQDDDAFKHIVARTTDAMELIEQGTSHIARFVRSTSGTRTLAFVSDSFTGPASILGLVGSLA